MAVPQIDPEILRPQGEAGGAVGVPEFYDVVIATINAIIDELGVALVVAHDVTLVGDGTPGDLLGVNATALTGLVAVATGPTIDGDGTTGLPLDVNSAAIGGTVAVATDGTIDGDGTTGSQLSVNEAALAGTIAVATDATVDGDGTTGDPLRVNTTAASPESIFPDAAGTPGVNDSFSRSDHVHPISAGIAVAITDSTNSEGVAGDFSRSDHLHSHGNRGGGALHAVVVPAGAAGFMSGADKSKLDGLVGGALPVLFWGQENMGAAVDTRYLAPGWQSGLGSLANDKGLVAPRDGTFRTMYARHNAAGGTGPSVAYTLLVNGVASALTASVPTGAIGQASDLVNTVAVLEGNVISIRGVKAVAPLGGGVNAVISVEFV